MFAKMRHFDWFQALEAQKKDGEKSNFVFSPFSLHTALAMLITGAKDDSPTQIELLKAMGRFQNIQGLQDNYRSLLKDYEVSILFEHVYVEGMFVLCCRLTPKQ